jgi:hypothetical protein
MGQRQCRRAGLLAAMATMWVYGPASAQTPPRAVAVIDATAGPTSDPEVAALAARLEAQLDREDDLVLAASERRPALVGGIPDEDASGAAEARSALTRARDALARFDDRDAVAEAGRGLTRAVGLPPAPSLSALIADLAFVRALAELDRDPAAAARDFALVHRMAAGRTLDPVKYLPEAVKLFEKAAKPATPATLTIEAPAGGEIWVDGASVGAAPAELSVGIGLHAVTVTGSQLVTRGQLVELGTDGVLLRIDTAEASGTMIVHRLRRTLSGAADDLARAVAIAAILRASGGQDAIVVGRDGTGEVVTWTYSGKSGVLSEAKPGKGRDAQDIVKPIRPSKVKVRDPDDGKVFPLPPPGPSWYQKRWVQVAIGSGVVAGIVTSVIIAVTRPVGTSEVGRDPIWVQGDEVQ